MANLFNYTLRYCGINFVNLINFLLKNEIKIFNVKKNSFKEVEFQIDSINYKKLKKLNCYYNLSVIKDGSVKTFLKTILKRIGVVVGCAFVATSNVVICNSVINVEVDGETILGQYIIDVVKDYNLENQHGFDCAKLEKYLLENISELSLVSVKKEGNTIFVNAMDKREECEECEPFYAPYNMLINDIKLISGTLMCSKNDIVKKGEMIVDSYTISSNGERILVPAKAIISADVWFCGSEVVMKENVLYENTGNKKVYLNLFFKDVKHIEKMSPYKDYVSETKIINVTNGYFMPIYLVKNVFYETKKIINIFDFEKEKNICLEKSEKKAYTNLPKNVTISEVKQNISELSDRYIFQTYLKTTMEINNEN